MDTDKKQLHIGETHICSQCEVCVWALIAIIPIILEGCVSRWSCHCGTRNWLHRCHCFASVQGLCASILSSCTRSLCFLLFCPLSNWVFNKFKARCNTQSLFAHIPTCSRMSFGFGIGRDRPTQVAISRAQTKREKMPPSKIYS